jgi:ABC-type branched-subunit amino acid transport system ATPase component
VQTFGWLTVEDNVLAATEWHGGGGGFLADVVGWPARRRRERARRADVAAVLARCGLEGAKDELAGSLPIGTARMVELARAIVDRPRLLLLDEPASGLDETEAARLGALIHQVRDESGCAIVLVEHDAGFVMRHCARIVVLDQGHVLSEGAPREIQNDQRVRDAYLGEGAGVVGEANEN